MLRNILAVVIGYIVIALVVVLGLFGAYFLLGADRAFQPGSYDLTTTGWWCGSSTASWPPCWAGSSAP